MKTVIVPEKCIACGLCQVLAPNTFDYTDQGIVIFKHNETLKETTIQPDDINAVINAYKECPTRAIIIEK